MGDTVIIRHQRARDFTILDNEQVRDARLSWKARGLIAYLLSLPEGWQLRTSFLVEQAPDGRCSTTAGLAELKKFGYLLIERERGARGRFVRTVWTIIQKPPAVTTEGQSGSSRLPQPLDPGPDKPPTSPQSENRIVVTSHHDPENRIMDKWIGTTEETSVRRTTTTDSVVSTDELVKPSALKPAEVVVVENLVSQLPAALAQQVLDELAGAMARPGRIKASPVGFLRSLVQRAQHDEFNPALGIEVAAARERRAQENQKLIEERAERKQREASAAERSEVARAHLAEISQRLGVSLPPQSSEDHDEDDKPSQGAG